MCMSSMLALHTASRKIRSFKWPRTVGNSCPPRAAFSVQSFIITLQEDIGPTEIVVYARRNVRTRNVQKHYLISLFVCARRLHTYHSIRYILQAVVRARVSRCPNPCYKSHRTVMCMCCACVLACLPVCVCV